MNNKPDLEHGVYRVTHLLLLNGSRYVCESDLIFLEAQPFVVLEWGGPPGHLYPDVKVAIDLSRLGDGPGGEGYFVYDGDVADPRKLQ